MSAATIPVSGDSFTEIAARSRSMHKTQGFGNFGGFGGGSGPRSESFALLDGEPVDQRNIMDGVEHHLVAGARRRGNRNDG